MGPLKIKTRTLAAATVVVVCAMLSAGDTHSRTATQEFRASARAVSDRLGRSLSADVSFLIVDFRSGDVVASQWERVEEPVPVGSLVKPFTALAYAEAHGYKFPRHVCSGGGSCWLPRGHGNLDVEHAVAQSCNSYFAQLARDVSAEQVTGVAQRFGLRGPGIGASAEAMIGKYGVWHESPEAIARAYAELLQRRTQPGVREIVEGMALAGTEGTAAAIGRSLRAPMVLAKTGTAPCTHREHAPGDGWVVAAWPAQSPKYLLVLRQHGKPGALAAKAAAVAIRNMEQQ